MKEISVHAAALAAAVAIIFAAEMWYEGDWLLGVLTVAAYGLYLQGWKRWGTSGIGIVITTVFYLFTLDSIFFVQDIPAIICSFLMGLLLISKYARQKDGIFASLAFVLLNILISFEIMPNEWMMWLIVFAAGTAALIGFRFDFTITKVCFTVLFSLAALYLLVMQVSGDTYVMGGLALLSVGLFIAGMVLMNGKVAA